MNDVDGFVGKAGTLHRLIRRSEEHRDQQVMLVRDLRMRGERTAMATEMLRQIEHTLAALRAQQTQLHAMEKR